MTDDPLAAAVASLVDLAPDYFRYSPDWALMAYFPKYTEEYYLPLNWMLCGRIGSYTPQHDPQNYALLHAGLLRLAAEEFSGYTLVTTKGDPLHCTAQVRLLRAPFGAVKSAYADHPTTALLYAVVAALKARANAGSEAGV